MDGLKYAVFNWGQTHHVQIREAVVNATIKAHYAKKGLPKLKQGWFKVLSSSINDGAQTQK